MSLGYAMCYIYLPVQHIRTYIGLLLLIIVYICVAFFAPGCYYSVIILNLK